jgi:uncharacterized protein (TIGR02246 family)
MRAASADRRDLAYPTNHVVGTITEAGQAQAAIEELLRAGFDRKDIDILHDEADLNRLDPTGAHHGFLTQFHRSLIRTFDLQEFKHLTHHVEDVKAGRYVIMVLIKRRAQRIAAADALHHNGAQFVGFYGRWAWAELLPHEQTTPQDIPVLFVRAWNNRDADALAALFDLDAEFVCDTGERWHDRESIRKAHASRLNGGHSRSTLANGETKVKLLSPEVAVVYAQMTRSGEDSAGTPGPLGPRTTIVSFVVHRAGDVWRCASAQNTDVAGATTRVDAAI